MADEEQIHCHQQLQKLYNSTRVAKHFQKDTVHAIEGFISVSLKQMDVERRFAEDCRRYQAEYQYSTFPLAETADKLGTSHSLMLKEKENFVGILCDKVSKPLRALASSAQLEDARHLTHCYDKLWQEAEAQAAEALRQRSKSKDGKGLEENAIRIHAAEAKLDDLKSRLTALGKEATSAMLAVEAHQQQMTLQQILIMVDAERSCHRNVLAILEKLHAEMIREKQLSESSTSGGAAQRHSLVLDTDMPVDLDGYDEKGPIDGKKTSFLAKVVHPFDAEVGELNLLVDDVVVVNQVIPGGWSKGECNGKTGCFPSPYVQRVGKADAK